MKNKDGGISLPGFRLYYRTTQYGLGTKRHIYQWDRTESPEVRRTHTPHTQPINWAQRGQERTARKNSLFNRWCWEAGQPHAKKGNSTTIWCRHQNQPKTRPPSDPITKINPKLDHYLTPCTKINPKWIEDSHVKTWNYKIPRGKHISQPPWHWSWQ